MAAHDRPSPWHIETVKATLDCARADVDAEDDRAKVLNSKLSNLATLAALSLSISASLGANVLVAGDLCTEVTIAVGFFLTAGVLMLLRTVFAAFRGLRPKEYRGITLPVATARVTPHTNGSTT